MAISVHANGRPMMMEVGFDKGLAPNWNAPAIAVVTSVAQKSAI